MRILIFGAGVIGSLYGELLAGAGYDVSVYARGQRLKAPDEMRQLHEQFYRWLA